MSSARPCSSHVLQRNAPRRIATRSRVSVVFQHDGGIEYRTALKLERAFGETPSFDARFLSLSRRRTNRFFSAEYFRRRPDFGRFYGKYRRGIAKAKRRQTQHLCYRFVVNLGEANGPVNVERRLQILWSQAFAQRSD